MTVGNARAAGSLLGGIATMLGSGASSQVGAAMGAHAFATIGPAGVVAVRQFVAAAVLLPIARPDLRRFTWGQWWPTLLLGLVFAAMNLSLYTAIDRIGLGLAVTLEFLGPLAVALASSRSRLDLLCAVAACAGVYLLVLPGPASDFVGVGLGLVAAACWAAYILLNRMVGTRLPGLQAPAAAAGVSTLLYLPVAATLISRGQLDGAGVLYATGAGLLSSVVPYAADLIALRGVPPHLFGVFMSCHPVLAALAGITLLDQPLKAHEWAGIAIIVTANALAVRAAARPRALPRRQVTATVNAVWRTTPSAWNWRNSRCSPAVGEPGVERQRSRRPAARARSRAPRVQVGEGLRCRRRTRTRARTRRGRAPDRTPGGRGCPAPGTAARRAGRRRTGAAPSTRRTVNPPARGLRHRRRDGHRAGVPGDDEPGAQHGRVTDGRRGRAAGTPRTTRYTPPSGTLTVAVQVSPASSGCRCW